MMPRVKLHLATAKRQKADSSYFENLIRCPQPTSHLASPSASLIALPTFAHVEIIPTQPPLLPTSFPPIRNRKETPFSNQSSTLCFTAHPIMPIMPINNQTLLGKCACPISGYPWGTLPTLAVFLRQTFRSGSNQQLHPTMVRICDDEKQYDESEMHSRALANVSKAQSRARCCAETLQSLTCLPPIKNTQ